MLRGFLDGLAAHLTPGGEGWLILSDLAEHLGLRSRDDLLDMIARAGLRAVDRIDTRRARAADIRSAARGALARSHLALAAGRRLTA